MRTHVKNGDVGSLVRLVGEENVQVFGRAALVRADRGRELCAPPLAHDGLLRRGSRARPAQQHRGSANAYERP